MATVTSVKVEGAEEASAQIQKVQKSLDGFNKAVNKNRDATRLLDKATGGAVTKFQDLQKGVTQGIVGVKGLATSFKGLKGAIAATGIGLIVIALGTIVAYWDEIKGLVSGVSLEQQKLLTVQQESAKETENAFNNINASANILKQQGVTEREILDLKIQSTNESISALEAQLATQKEIKKAQVETAERNAKILSGIVLLLTAPLAAVLVAVDQVAKVFGMEAELAKNFYEGVGTFVFDPEGIAKEGEESIKETEKQLLALKNRKAGFENNITKIEEQEFAKRQAAKQAQYKIEFDAYKKHLEKMTDLTITDLERLGKIRSDYNAKIADQAITDNQTRLDLDRAQALLEVEELNLNGALKGNAELAINTFFDNKQKELTLQNLQETLDGEIEIEEKKRKFANDTLDNAARIAGEESKLGKALLVAKQALALQSFLIDIGALQQKASIAVAGANLDKASAGTAIAKGTAETAKIGFPQNILPLIGYAATAAGIISSIASAVKSTKTVAASVGGSSGTSGETPKPVPTPPAFNIVGQSETSQLSETIANQNQKPVQAFVVSNDVTTAQSLQRNIVQGATI
tara:strand:- start:1102 stop:2835 length:1734 start_codon:yes stop_codon:yes gene_type:complete